MNKISDYIFLYFWKLTVFHHFINLLFLVRKYFFDLFPDNLHEVRRVDILKENKILRNLNQIIKQLTDFQMTQINIFNQTLLMQQISQLINIFDNAKYLRLTILNWVINILLIDNFNFTHFIIVIEWLSFCVYECVQVPKRNFSFDCFYKNIS